MMKYPIGLQNFAELRSKGFVYVDKTKYVYQLAEEGKYYFLSRPRRFGKSLLLSTIAELFKGKKELFADLWIEDKWNWNQKNPVLHFFFNEATYKIEGLAPFLSKKIQEQARLYDIELTEISYPAQLRELIQKLSVKQGQVVLLIDEYDKPIIDYLHDISQAKVNREILKNFYSVLKPLDADLRMVFITGVSKFSRVSIFSELNNLLDLTLSKKYNSICGYSQEDMLFYFGEGYLGIAQEYKLDAPTTVGKIKQWYNGYSWGNPKETLYNPFSILQLFNDLKFSNYWFESGTPTFLIKLMQKNGLHNPENLEVSEASLGNYHLDQINTPTLLFQTGYLTIKESLDFGLYRLGYPNLEVKESMLRYLIAGFTNQDETLDPVPAQRMAFAIKKGQIDQLQKHINALLHSIPYDLHQNNEGYYHTIMHLAFTLVGVHIDSEIHVAKGRLDSIVKTEQAIYIFEFKVNSSAENALEQIKAQGYAKPFTGQEKPIYLIGVSFNTDLKEVDSWLVEKLKA